MNVRTIELPCIDDARGSLLIAETEHHVPFPIRRVYSLIGVPGGVARGAHGHRKLEQCFLVLGGSFLLTVTDGVERESVCLERPSQAFYVGPMLWRELSDFTPGTVCLVLASEHFDEADYVRDYDAFLRLRSGDERR